MTLTSLFARSGIPGVKLLNSVPYNYNTLCSTSTVSLSNEEEKNWEQLRQRHYNCSFNKMRNTKETDDWRVVQCSAGTCLCIVCYGLFVREACMYAYRFVCMYFHLIQEQKSQSNKN
jgi:hypothetical protein